MGFEVIKKSIWIFVGFVLQICPSNAQNENSCVDFYSASQRDIKILDSENAAFASTYNQLCKNSTSSKSLSASANFVVSKIPINLDGKSDQQKTDAFCSYGATQAWSMAKLSTRDENVVRESFQAFNACMEIRNRNIKLTHQYSEPTGLVVKFDNQDVNLNVSFLGVQLDPRGNLSCSLTEPDKEPRPLTNRSKSLSLIGKTFIVSCTRAPSQTKPRRVFSRESLVLTTNVANAGPLPLVMPSLVEDGTLEETRKDAEIRRLAAELEQERKGRAAEVAALTPVRAKSYVLTSAMTLPAPVNSLIRDLRSPDLEPAAPCGRFPWGHHVPLAAKKLCERDGLTFKGEPTLIFTSGGGGCGHTAFVVTCVTR